MLPDNTLSDIPVRASFLYPDRFQLGSLTEDYEMGGIAIQDPSEGLQYQPWFGYWRQEDSAVCVRPAIDGEDTVLFTEPDLFEMSFTFDQNMRWVCATQRTDGSFRFRWYDSAVADYVVTEVEGVTAFHCALDDKRAVSTLSNTNDILVTYIKDRNLYVRVQRERYEIEHLLANTLPKNLRISNFGMNERYRVQWRLRYRRPDEVQPWLL